MIPRDRYLLQSNNIKGVQYSATKSALMTQVKHKPNRRIFLIKAHLTAHRIGRRVGLDKIGEKPILLDTAGVKASADNIHRYLFKKGYFNNEVTYSIHQGRWAKFFHQRKLKVTYLVTEGTPYTIDSVRLITSNPEIQSILEGSKEKSHVREGEILDYDNIGYERTRINTLLKNKGFYYFNPSYVEFVVDTAKQNSTGTIEVHILDPAFGNHTMQRINSIKVEFLMPDSARGTSEEDRSGIYYQLNGMDINTRILSKNILFRPGDLFSQQKLQNTYGRLVGLDLFQSLSIQNTVHDGDSTRLDMLIRLQPSPKYDFTWQPQVISTEQRFNQSKTNRNYGLANEISLSDKNVFHNGEELSLNFRTALETQLTRDSNGGIFSTFVQEVNADLKIPQLLFFPNLSYSPGIAAASTHFSASYLYENNLFYRRNLFPLSYTYQVESGAAKLYVSPLLISLNKATYKRDLLEQASASYIQTLDRLFTNNLITSWKISGVYSNQAKSPKSYFLVNTNLLEVAGAVLPQLTDYGQRLDVNHSTFIRTDVDFRYHLVINENNELIGRGFSGIGVPIGNRSVLPYERRFFGGGANYLRGWRLRTVGPGSFTAPTTLQFTRTGEFSMVGNLEYRFNVIRGAVDVNGAAFVDAGNIWNLKADTLFPGGDFVLDRFYHEIAINGGLGLRIDFEFLLLRADWGVPIWDPNFPVEDRLVINGAFRDKWLLRRPIWHVAVGYPF